MNYSSCGIERIRFLNIKILWAVKKEKLFRDRF